MDFGSFVHGLTQFFSNPVQGVENIFTHPQQQTPPPQAPAVQGPSLAQLSNSIQQASGFQPQLTQPNIQQTQQANDAMAALRAIGQHNQNTNPQNNNPQIHDITQGIINNLINQVPGGHQVSQAVQPVANQLSQTTPQQAQGVLQTASQYAQMPFSPVINALKANVDIAKGATGFVTNNQEAMDNGFGAAANDYNSIFDTARQMTTRPAAQIATTLGVVPMNYTPGTDIEKAVFGDQPIQNIQSGVMSTYHEHPELDPTSRAVLAGLYGAGQVAQDLPVAGGILKGARGVRGVKAPTEPLVTEPITAPGEAPKVQTPTETPTMSQTAPTQATGAPTVTTDVPGVNVQGAKGTPHETAQQILESNPTGTDAFGVKPLAVDVKPDVVREYKAEGNGAKVTSDLNRASKLGGAGEEAAQRINNVEHETAIQEAAMQKQVQKFHNLTPEEQATAWDVREGKTTTTDPKIQAAVDELNEFFPKVLSSSRQAGLKVGDLGENYMPRHYPKGFFNNPKNFQDAVKQLVESGKASSEAEAIEIMNGVKGGQYLGGRRFGNLDLSRVADLPGYLKNSEGLNHYIKGAARRIVEARQFGANGEIAQDLVGRAQKSGYDGKALADILGRYLNPEYKGGAIDKVASGVRKTTAVLQLQKAALKHLPQGFANIGTEIGFTRYFRALGRQIFSDKDYQYIRDSGFKNENDLHGNTKVGAVTAPGLKQLRQFHRETAAIGGKLYAEGLAKRGDVEGLRKWGVTGEIERDSKGGIQLTDTQKYQVSHTLSDRTIYSNNAAQSPAWAQQGAGKFIGQYRTAYVFKQAGFINNLFKEAGKGNIAPLVRYLAVAAPVSGAVVTGAVDLYTGKFQKNPEELARAVARNSGALSVGAGVPESLDNVATYSYDGPSLAANTASVVAPTAGTLIQTGTNIQRAVTGNAKPLVNQGLGYLPGSGYIKQGAYALTGSNLVKPTDPKAAIFGEANANAIKSLPSGPAGDDARKGYAIVTGKYYTADGQPLNPSYLDRMTAAQEEVKNPSILQALQQRAQEVADKTGDPIQPEFDPKYTGGDGKGLNGDTMSKLQVLADYNAAPMGGPEREVLKDNNPWIQTLQAATTQYYKDLYAAHPELNPKSPEFTGVQKQPNNDPDFPLTDAQSALMTEAGKITDPTEKAAFYLQHPEMTQIGQKYGEWVNQIRHNENQAPLPQQPSPTASQQATLNAYAALPDRASKNAFIKSHQNAWNDLAGFFTQASSASLVREASKLQVSGKNPMTDQKFLKSVYNLGQYDVVKGSDGNFYAPSLPSSQGGSQLPPGVTAKGGGGSSFKASTPKYKAKLPKLRVKIASAPKAHFKHTKLRKGKV